MQKGTSLFWKLNTQIGSWFPKRFDWFKCSSERTLQFDWLKCSSESTLQFDWLSVL